MAVVGVCRWMYICVDLVGRPTALGCNEGRECGDVGCSVLDGGFQVIDEGIVEARGLFEAAWARSRS